MRVLAIMSHPDDMELHCAGTLLKYKKLGHDVITCHAANGNMGHYVIMPDELREIRRKEAQNAAKIAGYEVISADIDDLTINSASEEQINKLNSELQFISRRLRKAERSRENEMIHSIDDRIRSMLTHYIGSECDINMLLEAPVELLKRRLKINSEKYPESMILTLMKMGFLTNEFNFTESGIELLRSIAKRM